MREKVYSDCCGSEGTGEGKGAEGICTACECEARFFTWAEFNEPYKELEAQDLAMR